jgi:lysophospholipase L1-like esterase
MATYLTLDSRYGITTFDPSSGYTIITDFSELIDDADVIPILEIASAQVPPVFILVSDHPITQPEDGVSADVYITQQDLTNAMARVVRVDPQTFSPDDQTQARTNIDAEEDAGALTGLVRYDTAQSLTSGEKAQARTNIGAGTGGGGSSSALPGYISVYDPVIGTVAVGDGTTDDTAALNAAETYVLANGFLGVDLGVGTYKITGPVKFSTAVRGAGGNESKVCVIKCGSSTASVSWGYTSAGDTVHARVATGFVVDMNGTGDPSITSGRFIVLNVKGIIMDVNVTDFSFTTATFAGCVAGNAVYYNGAQNVEAIQLNSSAAQNAALCLDNGTGGCSFKSCHNGTAGTCLRITDGSPGSSAGNGSGFPFGPASNSFDNCIYETRLADSVQLISAECGAMQVFTHCQLSVSTSTGILTSGAMVNVTGDIIFKGLTAPFSTTIAFGDGCLWNGGAKGAVGGTNPVNAVAVDGFQIVDFTGVQDFQNVATVAYNKAGSGNVRVSMTGLITGGGFGTKVGASSSLSDAKQAIAVGTGVTGYTLTFGANTTASIGPADTAASIQTKLQALASIGSGNILVTGENGVYAAHFVGAKAGAAQATMTNTPTGGTVTITPYQVGGALPSTAAYANSLNSLRVNGDFSRAVHYAAVAVASLSFNADVTAYSEIQFVYTNNTCNLTAFTLINPSDGQIFTITHQQSTQGESSYVWPSNVVFRGPTPTERAASGFVSVTFRYYKTGDQWIEESRSGQRQTDLPYYAGTLQHAYDPASGGYNFRPATQHKLRAKLGKTLAGSADTHIFFFGDSVLGGYGGALYVYDTCLPRAVGRGITAKQGAPWAQGIQYIIGDKTHLADNWIRTGASVVASIFLETTGVSTLTRTPPPGETGTAVDIYYSDLGTTGITWSINGSAQTPLVTSGTNTIRKTTVTGLTLGAQTIVITGTAAHTGIFVATRVYTPAVKQVYIHNLSIGGSTANTGTGTALDVNWSSQSNSGTYGAGWVIENLISASTITPDAVVISLGGNDSFLGTTAATIITGLQNILAWSAVSGVPVYLIHAHHISGESDAVYNLLSKAKLELCDSAGLAMFNWDDWVGGLATATADGLIGADGTHPTAVLQTMAGTNFAGLLCK